MQTKELLSDVVLSREGDWVSLGQFIKVGDGGGEAGVTVESTDPCCQWILSWAVSSLLIHDCFPSVSCLYAENWKALMIEICWDMMSRTRRKKTKFFCLSHLQTLEMVINPDTLTWINWFLCSECIQGHHWGDLNHIIQEKRSYVRVCVCVCGWREREGEHGCMRANVCLCLCVCVCVCVWRERERERQMDGKRIQAQSSFEAQFSIKCLCVEIRTIKVLK